MTKKQVNDRVQDFVTKVNELNSICQDMSNKIQLNKAKTQDLLARTAALQNEKKTLEKKQVAIDDFLSHYSLTSEEEAALKGSEDGTVGANFFAALQRVKQIHSDSKQLLRTSGEHLAALEIMEEMANKLEEAYEVLYRSIQRECRLLNVEFLELKGILIQSIAALQEREVLFKYALDEYTMARKNHVVRAYIDALDTGNSNLGIGAGGMPRPIELLSHDSLRYIGDMLAWIHQAMATERELLQALLKLCSADVLKENSIGIQSQISEALCRPFKVRVEQALTTETNCIVLYRLSCLFTFYLETMSSSLNSDSMLIQTYAELKELTLNLFFSGLHSVVQKLVGKIETDTPDYDLLPVPAVHQVLVLLKEVLESHDGAVVAVAEKKNFEKIFTTVLDPLNQAVQLSATQLDSPIDISVYTLNCLSVINTAIIFYQFADSRLEMIKAQTDANVDVLVSEQATFIITQTGLIELYRKAGAHQPNQEHYLKSLEWNRLEYQTHYYYLILFFQILINISLIRMLYERTIEAVVAAYRIIYNKVVDPSNKYPELSIKTVEQVETLTWTSKRRGNTKVETLTWTSKRRDNAEVEMLSWK
ncbi:Conserved oligomeric Golgi complex subunit 6 [Dirofilaria immitis]|nr:Conserved oligomeric Golgi complex subunit 6 [Dirofilaria immitis]